jgi:hypothetical protein
MEKPVKTCPLCQLPVQLRKNGRLGSHGRIFRLTGYEKCPRSGKKPS